MNAIIEFSPMPKHRHRRRGSSKAGRPKKAGDRYASGKLKPPGPNARVVADRVALLGTTVNLHNAENPLDLALARGWLSERHHRAAMAFRRIHDKAGIGEPGLSSGGPVEAPEPGAVDKRGLRELSSSEIVAAWDKAIPSVPRALSDERTAAAMAQWVALMSPAVLSAAERGELFRVCVQSAWPSWISWRVGAPAQTDWTNAAWLNRAGTHERRRDLLVSGLEKVARLLFKPQAREETPTIGDNPAAEPLYGPIREEVTLYVDKDGTQLYEAVRRTRR